jgi:hypothetical protein
MKILCKFLKPVLRSRSHKEPHHFSGAVKRCSVKATTAPFSTLMFNIQKVVLFKIIIRSRPLAIMFIFVPYKMLICLIVEPESWPVLSEPEPNQNVYPELP